MSQDTRGEKEELLHSLLMKERLLLENKKFVPNEGFQERFYRSRKRLRFCFAGNQSGKTTVGARELRDLALGVHPYKKVRVPNISFIVSGQGFQTGIVKTIVPKLREISGLSDIKRIKNNSQGIPVEIQWKNGSITHLMSTDQDDMSFEGTTFDFGWIDEPVRRDIFVGLWRGVMARGGMIFFTGTALEEPWLYDEIYLKWKNGDPLIECFEGSSYENKAVSVDKIKEFESLLTSDEKETRIHGKFKHMSGRVIKEYEQERHVVPAFSVPPHWPVWAAIDPHRNKPHSVIWVACSPSNVFYVCNEMYYKCTIDELADWVLKINSQYNVVETLIDTSAQEDGWNRVSARSLLAEKGLYTKLAQKRNKKGSGILMINQLFKEDRLFVFRTCKRMQKELLMYVYKKTRDSKVLEEPEKNWDDTIDPLRYILVESPRYSGVASIKDNGPTYRFTR